MEPCDDVRATSVKQPRTTEPVGGVLRALIFVYSMDIYYNFSFLLCFRKGTLGMPETELDAPEIYDSVRFNVCVSMFHSYMCIDGALLCMSRLPCLKLPASKYSVSFDFI